MTRHILAIVLAVVASATVWADAFDDYMAKTMKDKTIPGAAFAVVKDGKIVREGYYGVSNVELGTPATADTLWEIGSMSKQFCASVVMMLSQEGKIGLDDALSKYIPGLPETWSGVTIRRLLSHTSGVRNWGYELPGWSMSDEYKPEEFVKLLTSVPLDFEPGSKYSYSNSGYALLGMVVKKVTGKDLSEVVPERCFKPAGMSMTRYNDPYEIVPGRASGYLLQSGGKLTRGNPLRPKVAAPSGGVLSTPRDLAKWDAALLAGSVVPKTLLEQMWTPAKLNDGKATTYGFGWALQDQNGRKAVHHTGTTLAGFNSAILRLTNERVTVILLTNRTDVQSLAIANDLANIYLAGSKSRQTPSQGHRFVPGRLHKAA